MPATEKPNIISKTKDLARPHKSLNHEKIKFVNKNNLFSELVTSAPEVNRTLNVPSADSECLV